MWFIVIQQNERDVEARKQISVFSTQLKERQMGLAATLKRGKIQEEMRQTRVEEGHGLQHARRSGRGMPGRA